MANESSTAAIGGIFPRLGAFVIDVLAVVGAGMLLARLLAPVLSPIGPEARLFGYAALVAYFGFFDHFSATPGKRLMRLQVRRADGSRVPLPLTLGRSAILFVPFLCSGPNPGLIKWNTAWTTTEIAIVYTLGGALPLVWLLGGRARQSVHDIVCRTYVVSTTRPGVVGARPSRRLQSGLMLGWCAIILAVMARMQPVMARYTRWPDQPKLEAADQRILAMRNVKGTGYTLLSDSPDGKNGMLPAVTAVMTQLPKTLVVSVDVRRKPQAPEALERQVARTLLDAYPPAARQTKLEVVLAYGYDIGIARSYKTFDVTAKTADAWLGKPSTARDAAAERTLNDLSLAPPKGPAMPLGKMPAMALGHQGLQ